VRERERGARSERLVLGGVVEGLCDEWFGVDGRALHGRVGLVVEGGEHVRTQPRFS
jgi:hypothetical protein